MPHAHPRSVELRFPWKHRIYLISLSFTLWYYHKNACVLLWMKLIVATSFEHLQFYIFTSRPRTLIRTTRNEVKTDRIIRVQTVMFWLINSIHRELMFLVSLRITLYLMQEFVAKLYEKSIQIDFIHVGELILINWKWKNN